jgi:hypothetical protein
VIRTHLELARVNIFLQEFNTKIITITYHVRQEDEERCRTVIDKQNILIDAQIAYFKKQTDLLEKKKAFLVARQAFLDEKQLWMQIETCHEEKMEEFFHKTELWMESVHSQVAGLAEAPSDNLHKPSLSSSSSPMHGQFESLIPTRNEYQNCHYVCMCSFYHLFLSSRHMYLLYVCFFLFSSDTKNEQHQGRDMRACNQSLS